MLSWDLSVRSYDRDGNLLSISEKPLESSLISPIDFVGAGLATWVGKKFLGHGVRSVATAVEGTAAGAGTGGVRASMAPWTLGPTTMVENGSANFAGEILLNPNLVHKGATKFAEVISHEGVHRLLSARSGLWVSFRQRWAERFYLNSHLLRYTEEALAETIATVSLRRGLAFPFTHGYGISGFRLAAEAGGAGVGYGGMLYGSYRLGSFLGDSDRR